MKCKFCFAELEEDVTVCPVCSKELTEPAEIPAEETAVEETAVEVIQPEEVAEEETAAEETVPEKKKSKAWKIVLAVAGIVVLAAVLTGVILYSMGLSGKILRTLGIGIENDVYYKESYTAEDAVLEKKADVVVATMGDQVLTNGELQAHYWMSVFDFMDYYGYYLSYMGVDLSQPLDQLVYDEETGMTYQQMFLENAIESWRRYATLVEMSKEAGFSLSEEQKAELDTFPEQFKELAAENGYTDMDEFIQKEFFPGCSMESYLQYNTMSYTAVCYFDVLYETLMPTQEDVEAYYTENEADFVENGAGKDAGNYYDVRHILVAIEGEQDEEGNYSDADWEACRVKAQQMLDDFLAGEATEEAFAALATANSADPGSASNGGLYRDLTKDYGFIEGFENWYVDESRQVGDTGLVKNTESTTQGYHIMYFSGSKPIWEYEAKSLLLSDRTSQMLEEAEAKWPSEINYKKIVLGHLDMTTE